MGMDGWMGPEATAGDGLSISRVARNLAHGRQEPLATLGARRRQVLRLRAAAPSGRVQWKTGNEGPRARSRHRMALPEFSGPVVFVVVPKGPVRCSVGGGLRGHRGVFCKSRRPAPPGLGL